MSNRRAGPPDNVVWLPNAARPHLKRLQFPLEQTIAQLQEIAAVSGDHLVTEGAVHPDHRLLALCAEALQLARLAQQEPVHAQQQELNRAAAQPLKRARKLRATTPAGVYAKALLVQVSVTGAIDLARSLAEDLISCDGLRHSLTWAVANQ